MNVVTALRADVLKAYWDLKQSQGGDVYSAKMVLHGLSDEAMHQKRPK